MAAAEQLITANLDIWSSAIKIKSAAGRGKSNKLELYGIKKLRELIMELAVRGVLVPQDPSDEPASTLLKRIRAEREATAANQPDKRAKKQAKKTTRTKFADNSKKQLEQTRFTFK